MNLFKDKVAVITGVGSGIGRECAERFSAEGASVAGVDINTGRMAELEQTVTANGCGFLGLSCDVRDPAAVKAVFAQTFERFGHIDLVINVAGVSSDRPITHTTEKEFERVMDINVKGTFHFCKYATPYFKKQKHGVIVNTASVTGIYGSGIGCPYPTSKAAIIGLTNSLSIELAPWNVRVNCVAPGVVDTEMVAGLSPKAKEAFSGTIPLKRLASPGDVAASVLFLASDQASYITGNTICVDGGYRPPRVTM